MTITKLFYYVIVIVYSCYAKTIVRYHFVNKTVGVLVEVIYIWKFNNVYTSIKSNK